MTVPQEFTVEAVDAASAEAFRPYEAFLNNGEPYLSIYLHNQWLKK